MNLAKLYKKGFYDDNPLDLNKEKLSKLFKWTRKAKEARDKEGRPLFMDVHLNIWPDQSGYVEAELFGTKETISLVSIEYIEVEK